MWSDCDTRYQWICQRYAELLREAEVERMRTPPPAGSILRAKVAAFLRGLANRLDPDFGNSEPFSLPDLYSM